ncbi:MAG: acetyl-CoA carboxylase biotin carboxyl carrier protein [Rhodobacterales bacterium]|nr:acetyl-CoA carboxylase biotin carboxyl carrier protein [Rhodobacterales bacterium]
MTKKTTDSDVSFIQALAELLNTNELTEIEVKRQYGNHDSMNVRVSRKKEVITQIAAAPVAAAPAIAAAAPVTVTAAADPATDPASDPNAVTSPMVGTVYLQSEPGVPAFVSVGAAIAEGDTILIIEAMKTMNHIPAPRAGTVKRILVDDGSVVEFGAPLVIIE